jgi:hypothetical protein
MDNKYANNGIPIFDGHNYEMWNIRMNLFYRHTYFYVSQSVVARYTDSKKPNIAAKKELKINNKISMDFIFEGLPDLVKEKVRQFSSTKELWDKLHNFFYKETPLIIEPNHVDQDKEDTETEQEEICSSCQIDP